MPQLPEKLRPFATWLGKYHFWLLAALLPLILVPLLWIANGALQAQIKTHQGQIEAKLTALRGVTGVQPHPNESWSTSINADTDRIRRETLAEWERFWAGQEPLRVWPQEMRDDFLGAVAVLKPDGRLDRNMLQRYQNTIPEVVRKLPARMGADDLMAENPAAGRVGVGPGAATAPASKALVQWKAEDQSRIYGSFTWQRLPTTTQVLLAQEELWAYGLLCDAIARANKGAAGAYNAAIVAVEHMAVGYPAAEDTPGGMGGQRIKLPKVAAGAMPEGDPALAPDGLMPGGPGVSVRPAHPRFGGPAPVPVQGFGAAPAADPSAAGASPDDPFREWIYTDFSGKPLTAAELAASPAARMVHLMPFVLRMVIDQRKLDGLLADLAQSPAPIDVRQVRINASATPHEFGAPPGAEPTAAAGSRDHDVHIELRGTIGLATPPNPAAIGIQPDQPAAPDGAAVPAAALPARGGRGRTARRSRRRENEVAR